MLCFTTYLLKSRISGWRPRTCILEHNMLSFNNDKKIRQKEITLIMKPTNLKHLSLGTGTPKICVPITGSDVTTVIAQAGEIVSTAADVVEWRLDYLNNLEDTEAICATANRLVTLLGELPLIVTLRDRTQGGKRQISDSDYQTLYTQLIANSSIAAIDLEWHRAKSTITHLIALATANNVATIISQHYFDQTPTLPEMTDLLIAMATRHGSFVKLAVMPQSNDDVLNLMTATHAVADQLTQPIISMAMGDLGAVTRVTGATFGSVMTFATVRHSSAPGQLTVEQTKKILDILTPGLPHLNTVS